MLIVFVSNIYNHHQAPLSEELYKLTNGKFAFVEIEPSYVQGYQKHMNAPFVVSYETEKEKALQLILSADVVIFGSCPNELIAMRMKKNKFSFLYSERFFKKGQWRRLIPSTRNKVMDRIGQYRDKNIYVLCASAYLSSDLSLVGFPVAKCFKWGYFPQVKSYEDINKLIESKQKNSILWVGRMLDWKHPEVIGYIANKLRNDGYGFTFNVIGGGAELSVVDSQVKKNQLGAFVKLLGSMPSEDVRKYMQQSEIYIASSDYYEGWGAVINEAMNSACAVIGSHAMGSAPYLIHDAENGLLYKSGDMNQLYQKVKYLLDNKNIREKYGQQAYLTITQQWCPKNAARRIVELSKKLLNEEETFCFENGVCSRAESINNKWYR